MYLTSISRGGNRCLIFFGALKQHFQRSFLRSLLIELPNCLDTPGDDTDQSRGGGHAQQQWGELSHCPSDNVFDHA
jgi:hypothetical protein